MNPVWTVYNELHTARLNVKYLQRKLRTLKRVNLSYEIILAVATSSTVAGFSFWQGGAGKAIWPGVGVVAALLSIVKPILKLPEAFQRKQELLASYMILDHDLNTIGLEIQFSKKYDEALRGQFARALERKSELVKKDIDSSVNERLRRRCYNEVLRELPADSFYIPPEK
jgi:hypothetical protein